MARIRTVKPEFFTDDTLAECSPSARLLLVGLLCFADDNGNVEASPAQAKMRVFPADNIDTKPLLDQLESKGLLIRYAEKFFHIKGFTKHQRIDNPSKPRCPLFEDSARTPLALPEDSAQEGKGREGKGIGSGRELEGIKHRCPISSDGAFEKFWTAYPKKTGKKAALKAYRNAKDKPHIDDLLKAIRDQASAEQWKRDGGRFIPNPATWINEGRWDDKTKTDKPPLRDPDEILRGVLGGNRQ